MFEELYKRANAKIPTEDAKARVVKKINTQNTAKKRINGVIKGAALAACLVLTIAMVGVYQNRPQSQIPQDAALRARPQEQEENKERVENVEPAAKSKSAPTEKTTKTPVQTPKKAQKSTTIVMNTTQEDAKAIHAGEPAARKIGKVVEVSKEQYYEYLGKNIEKTAVLPHGYEMVETQKMAFEMDENGEFLEDEWHFNYQKDEKTIEIVTTKNIEKISDIIKNNDLEKSKIADNDAIFIEKDTHFIGYMIADEIGYRVTGDKISTGEIEALFVSLTD